MKAFLRVDEFCKLLDISPTTFHKWRRKGIAPPVVQVSRRMFIRREALVAWLESHERGDAA